MEGEKENYLDLSSETGRDLAKFVVSSTQIKNRDSECRYGFYWRNRAGYFFRCNLSRYWKTRHIINRHLFLKNIFSIFYDIADKINLIILAYH